MRRPPARRGSSASAASSPTSVTPLFEAVMAGDVEATRRLLESGADPRRVLAVEGAEDVLTCLTLARQARLLLDWDRYHPIVELLLQHGASDEPDEPEDLPAVETQARWWQRNRGSRS